MDQYIVKICSNGEGPSYFYKNGKLHRESGSAIILVSKDDLIKLKLDDNGLYKIELIQEEIPPDYKSQHIPYTYKTSNPGISGTMTTTINAIHYLNGEPYSQEDFEKIKAKIELKNELSNGLTNKPNTTHKVKI